MPRLSCCFCIMASKSALVRAAQLNPTLARTYADLEARINHSFQNGVWMKDIIAEAEAASEPIQVAAWSA